MIHCCSINQQFVKGMSKGAFNSINSIESKSNVTFWNDQFYGNYYSNDKYTTLGLNDVQKSIVTVHDVEIAVGGEYGASSSLLMNTVVDESIVRVLRLVMNSSNPFNNGLLSMEQSINFKPD